MFRQDFLLQDDAAAAEIARLRLGHAVFAHIGQAHFVHAGVALGARSHGRLAREIDAFAIFAFVVLAEIKFQLEILDLFIAHDAQDGGERTAHLRAETLQRADGAVLQQLFHFGDFELARTRRLAHREFALGAGETTVVFLHHAAAIRAGRFQGGVVAGNGVVVVFLGALDDDLRHLRDFTHEFFTRNLAFFHLRQLVFPLARQLRRRQFVHAQAFEQGHQLRGLGGRDQFAAFADQVAFRQQALDGGRARRWRAESLAGHRIAQLVVVDQLAGAFHGRQQGRLREARGRFRDQTVGVDAFRLHFLALGDRHQVAVAIAFLVGVRRRFLAVDGQPARIGHDLAFSLELMAGHFRVARGDLEFRRREEHGHEAARDQVVQFLFRLGQILWRDRRRDDREVIRDLGIVEDALVRLDPALVDDLLGELVVVAVVLDRFQRLQHGRHVVFRQVARIGTRIRQHLVLFIQRLGQAQGVLGREAETRVGFALQAGQVEQARRHRGGRFRFFRDDALAAAAGGGDRVGSRLAPQALGALLGVVLVFLELRVEPAAFIDTGRADEFGAHFPEVARHEFFDLVFAFNDDGERWRLHAAHGGQIEAALFRIERRHGTRAIDTDQPIGFRTAAGRVGQRQHFFIAAQVRETVADGARRHRLQPQALDRLLGLGVLRDQAENQLAFTPRIACVDEGGNVFTFDQLV